METIRTIRSFSSYFDNFHIDNLAVKIQEMINAINGRHQIHEIDGLKKTFVNLTNNHMLLIRDSSQGTIEEYGEGTIGQISRFGAAWSGDIFKTKNIRIFGDRIELLREHPVPPRLFPFGQSPYFLLYPTENPDECSVCHSSLKRGTGVWVNEIMICASCQYEQDTGFKPGIKMRQGAK